MDGYSNASAVKTTCSGQKAGCRALAALLFTKQTKLHAKFEI
jgi:hypothetical protein